MKRKEITFNEFMSKLNSISFDVVDGKSLISDDGFKFSYSVKTSLNSELLFQVVFRLYYKNAMIRIWGCESEDQSRKVIEFFEKNLRIIEAYEMSVEKEDSEMGNFKFDKL